MFGLSGMPASGASLLLNAEGVFTALLAWFAFKENFDRRIALGTLAIVAGALVLSWPGDAQFGAFWPSVAVLGAPDQQDASAARTSRSRQRGLCTAARASRSRMLRRSKRRLNRYCT